MTPELRSRIAQVRKVLKTASPETGFLAQPSLKRSFPQDIPASYQEFLREVDGAVCGVVMLYEADGLLLHQADAKNLPGGRARWFCFGAVEDYPLVMDRQTEAVHLVPLEGVFDKEESVGNLDNFLLSMVFGPEYEDFVTTCAEDAWWQLLWHPR